MGGILAKSLPRLKGLEMAKNLGIINKKLFELQKERKQVLKHLSLIDGKIAILNQTIEIISDNSQNLIDFNTDNYTYRVKCKLFKGKVAKYLVQIMKNEDNRSFSIKELTEKVLEIEQNSIQPSLRHYNSIRQVLYRLHKQGLIQRFEPKRNQVFWQWNCQE